MHDNCSTESRKFSICVLNGSMIQTKPFGYVARSVAKSATSDNGVNSCRSVISRVRSKELSLVYANFKGFVSIDVSVCKS